jgi:hypothetical protein
MNKKISVKICGILFLLIVCSPIRSIVKDNDSYTNSNLNKKSSEIALLDTLKISSKTQIIGNCGNNSNPYNLYSFLLKDSTSIVQFAKSLVAGKKVMNMINGPEFNIEIVNDYLLTTHIAINPSLNTIRLKGNTYEFDFGQIKELHKEHPLISYEKKVSFSHKKEADNYVTEIKKDTNLLYYSAPEFNYEGSFSMTAEKSRLFNSPKAVMDYLRIEIEKIVSKGEYMMFYSFNVKQIDKVIQSDSYTITISGSKKLFDNLIVNKVKKDNWKSSGKEVGLFYMKR